MVEVEVRPGPAGLMERGSADILVKAKSPRSAVVTTLVEQLLSEAMSNYLIGLVHVPWVFGCTRRT